MQSFTIILLSLLIGCIASAGAPPPPQDIAIKAGLSDTPVLGRGYDSRSQNFVGTCVKDDGGSTNLNFIGSLGVRLNSNQNDAASSLGMQAGSRYRTGVTEVSAAAQFAQSTIETGYNVDFTYKFDSSYTQQFLLDGEHELDIISNFKNLLTNIRGFFFSCGDEYVSSLGRAARLLVNLNVSFSSKRQAQSFAANFAFNSPSVGVTAAIQKAASHVSKRTTMRFYSVQLGGTPGYSGHAICPSRIAGAAADNDCASPIIQCGFGNFDNCIKLLEGVVKYSASDFSNQVTTANGDPLNYAVVSVHTQPYIYAGGQFPLPPDKSTELVFTQELKKLNALFEGYFATWVLADHLELSGAPRLSPREAGKMILIEDGLHKIVNGLVTKIEGCYEYGYDTCHANSLAADADILKRLDRMRSDVDPILLARVKQASDLNPILISLVQPETFAQYCDLATDDDPEIKQTVVSMEKWAVAREAKAKTGKTFGQGDVCANFQSYFEQIKNLTLTNDGSASDNLPIGSLAPIAILKNLVSLNLSGQVIQDVTDLQSLQNLTSLKLDRDLIKNVCPLAGLRNLERLSVENNGIDSLKCLSAAPKLIALDARGNSNQLVCPLAHISGCKLKDFSKSVTVFDRTDNCGVHVGSEALAVSGHRVLVAGGATPAFGLQATTALDVYDEDSCSSSGAQLQIPRTNFTLTRLKDGRILAVGGYTDTLEVIDPVTFKSRLLKARMMSARSFHTATLLNDGRVLIVGGYTDEISINLRSNNISSSYEIFDPKTEQIEVRGRLSVPRAEHTATLLPDGRVLIIGGYEGTRNLSLAEIVDPIANTVTTLEHRLNVGRFGQSAVLLPNGDVLIAGGFQWAPQDSKGQVSWRLAGVKSLEIFDPKTETFSLVHDQLSVGRGLMGLQLMSDGRVLLFGGNTKGQLFDPTAAFAGQNGTDHEQALASASSVIEIFDPMNNGVFDVGNLIQRRSQLTFAPVTADSILVVGGMGSDLSLLTGELMVYNPPELKE